MGAEKTLGDNLSEGLDLLQNGIYEGLNDFSKETGFFRNKNEWHKQSQPGYGDLLNEKIKDKPVHSIKFFAQSHGITNYITKNETNVGEDEDALIHSQNDILKGLYIYKPDYIVLEGQTENDFYFIKKKYSKLIKDAFSSNAYEILEKTKDQKGNYLLNIGGKNDFSGINNPSDLIERLYIELGGATIYAILNDVKIIEGEPESVSEFFGDINYHDKNYYNTKILPTLDIREQHVTDEIKKVIKNKGVSKPIKFAISYGAAHIFKDNFKNITDENIKYNKVETYYPDEEGNNYREDDLGETAFIAELNELNIELKEEQISKNIKRLKTILELFGYKFTSESGLLSNELTKKIAEYVIKNNNKDIEFSFIDNSFGNKSIIFFNSKILSENLSDSDIISKICISIPGIRKNNLDDISKLFGINIPKEYDINKDYTLKDIKEYLKNYKFLTYNERLNLSKDISKYIENHFGILITKFDLLNIGLGELQNNNILKIPSEYIDFSNSYLGENTDIYFDFDNNKIITKDNVENDYNTIEYSEYINSGSTYNYSENNIETSKDKIKENFGNLENILRYIGFKLDEPVKYIDQIETLVNKSDDVKKEKNLIQIDFINTDGDKLITKFSPEIFLKKISKHTIISNIFEQNSVLVKTKSYRESKELVNNINDEFGLKIPQYFLIKNIESVQDLIPYLKYLNYLPSYEKYNLADYLKIQIKDKFGLKLSDNFEINGFGQSNNPNILKIDNLFVDRNQDLYKENEDYYFDLQENKLYSQNNKTGEIYKINKTN